MRITHAVAAAMALVSLSTTAALAAEYPSKPVSFVVPFGAGSATDQLARALGAAIMGKTGQAIVVENKPGASGIIAAQHVARAVPDGYTVLITTNTTQTANPHLFRKLPYNPLTDFQPVTALGRGGQVLVVRADAKYKDLGELIRQARLAPGKLTFGSGNSSSRVAGEMLKQLAKIDLTWVGYNSNPNAMNDLLGGHIEMMLVDTIVGLPQITAGKLRPLTATTATRVPQLPNVPTMQEAGIKDFEMGYWFAAYLPANTPASISQKLRDMLVQAVTDKQPKAFFQLTGTQAWTTTPAELSAFQRIESDKWGRVIKAAGIEPE
jgi:tripartite-type tricarboxylate transporter receptor subunit TctC